MNNQQANWIPPELPEHLPHGDMPGDKVCISQEHLLKAQTLYPALKKLVEASLRRNPQGRAVVTVCGGSGVGKSEIASLLAWYLTRDGIGSYTLSGDNYPRRIPEDNDKERLRVFRVGGLRGLVGSGRYNADTARRLCALQEENADFDPARQKENDWLDVYQQCGRQALAGYLGSEQEIDFDELTVIVSAFKQGAKQLYLKRMGRTSSELWYDLADMSSVRVLVIEWTHGNSDRYLGVDIPILLNSTPAETLAHRMARHRDGGADSPFTTMVLEIEQRLLESQAHKARLILSKSGELMDYAAYRQLMAQQQGGNAQ